MAWVELTEGCERPNPWWLLSRNQLEKVPGFTLEPVVDWLTGPNNLQNHHFCWWYNKNVKKKVFGHVWAISNSYPHALLVLPHPYFLTKKMILTSCTTGSIGSVANRQPAVLGWRQRASAARETRPVQRSPPVVHWSRTVLQPFEKCVWITSLSQHRSVWTNFEGFQHVKKKKTKSSHGNCPWRSKRLGEQTLVPPLKITSTGQPPVVSWIGICWSYPLVN